MLDRVTVTGADDSVEPEALVGLTERFPFVEWGILLSKTQEGSPRFPSLAWMERLVQLQGTRREQLQGRPSMKLSGHLCGRWVRDLCQGGLAFLEERPTIARAFERVQLNFHGESHVVDRVAFVEALSAWGRPEYIFQFDEANEALFASVTEDGIYATPLFDTSGGAGIEPASWRKPVGPYCGYAGGLHPDLIDRQLPRIFEAAGDVRFWIDIETHVRSHEDKQFDLDKVGRFLSAVAPHVSARKD